MAKSTLVAILALAAAGCATQGDTRLAAAEPTCKVVPITTASATGRAPRTLTPIEQRYAEMQLASTQYRQRQLQERGLLDNTVEQALRDCAAR